MGELDLTKLNDLELMDYYQSLYCPDSKSFVIYHGISTSDVDLAEIINEIVRVDEEIKRRKDFNDAIMKMVDICF